MKKYRRVLSIAILEFLVFFALVTIVRCITVIPIPHLQNYGECIVFVNAWGLATGHGLYRLSVINKVPMFFAAYSPIFYLLLAAGFKLWGISYIPGRTLALLATIGCAIMVALIARRRGCDNSSAIAGGLAFISTWPLYIFGAYLRVDQLAVFFELVAVYLILDSSISVRRAAVIVFFGVMAGYTKQTAFNLVLGSLIGLMIEGDIRQKKRIFVIGCAYGLAAAVIFFIMELITGWSFHQFINPKVYMGFSRNYFLERVWEVLRDPVSAVIIILGIMGIVFEKRRFWIGIFIGIPLVWALRVEGMKGTSCNHFI